MSKRTDRMYQAIDEMKCRSAWQRGVREYALEFAEQIGELIDGGYEEEENLASPKLVEKMCLNGAPSWHEYSWGGCSLIYDRDIAERLCTPSELKKKKGGILRPNKREEWLDVQTRALFQAAVIVKRLARTVMMDRRRGDKEEGGNE